MSLHEPAHWVVTYDIADARRGGRVLELMKKHGLPLQYSVFLVHASGSAMHALMHDLRRLIKPAADDVRAYRVPVGAECHQLGGTMLPDGTVVGYGALDTVLATSRQTSDLLADVLV